MLELEIDMEYCLDELKDGIILIDECRELPEMVFVPQRTCNIVQMDLAGNPPYRSGNWIYNSLSDGCSECGYPFDTVNNGIPKYCSNCGAKVMIL